MGASIDAASAEQVGVDGIQIRAAIFFTKGKVMWQTRGIVIVTLVLGFTLSARGEPKNYKGLQFFHHPPECELGGSFNQTPFYEGKSRVFLDEFICAGRAQLWLSRAVDKSGKEYPYNYEFKLNDLNEYLVDEVFMIPALKKNEAIISVGCTRNGVEPGPSFPFAFVIGTQVDIFNDEREVIGSYTKKIRQAWKVKVAKRKFEPISTKGIACEYIA